MNRPACVTGPLEKRKLVLEWVNYKSIPNSSTVNVGIIRIELWSDCGHWGMYVYGTRHDSRSLDKVKIVANGLNEAKLLAEEYLWKQASAICEMFEDK